jgi:hypothetical protein
MRGGGALRWANALAAGRHTIRIAAAIAAGRILSALEILFTSRTPGSKPRIQKESVSI